MHHFAQVHVYGESPKWIPPVLVDIAQVVDGLWICFSCHLRNGSMLSELITEGKELGESESVKIQNWQGW